MYVRYVCEATSQDRESCRIFLKPASGRDKQQRNERLGLVSIQQSNEG